MAVAPGIQLTRMDAFNYLSVLVSIILGLGITRLLTGLGQIGTYIATLFSRLP